MRITNAVVGALLGVALMIFAASVLDWKWLSLVAVLLAYEAWALVNKYPSDTLSESVWRYSRRPLIPLVFGVALGAGVKSGYIHDPWVLVALGLLAGHFFFQAQDVYEKESGDV